MRETLYSKIIICAFAALMLGGCGGKKKATATKKTPPPNIIYILADDLGYGDLSCFGQSKFKTPNIDKLASNGMMFTQHYAGTTVCAPSRSTLMTGQHTGHTFIRGNRSTIPGTKKLPEGQYPLRNEEVTVAELLKTKGYVTGAFGKWSLGFIDSEGDPNNQGFDEFYGYNCQSLAHNYYPLHFWHNKERIVLEENAGMNEEAYGPSLIHEKALSFIERNKNQPFFMYYPSIIPHAELFAPEEYMAKFRGRYGQEKKFKGVDDGKRYKKGGYGSQDDPHAAFAAMVTLLDDQIGEIIAKLEKLGIADNTLIIFTSDNGPHMEGGADPDFFNSNGALKGYKRDLYEGGIRVPTIAHWPGTIEANSKSNHLSAFWDFLPTVCEVAAIKTPKNIDGISFLPTLLGKKQPSHKYLYWEFHERNGKQAVRYGDWKGVRLNVNKSEETLFELYNLSSDIGEENNIADQHPEIVKKITSFMEKEHVYSKEFSFKHEIAKK